MAPPYSALKTPCLGSLAVKRWQTVVRNGQRATGGDNVELGGIGHGSFGLLMIVIMKKKKNGRKERVSTG